MNIKTYPLRFTEERLEEIREKASSRGQTIKDFMLDAIEKSLKQD